MPSGAGPLCHQLCLAHKAACWHPGSSERRMAALLALARVAGVWNDRELPHMSEHAEGCFREAVFSASGPPAAALLGFLRQPFPEMHNAAFRCVRLGMSQLDIALSFASRTWRVTSTYPLMEAQYIVSLNQMLCSCFLSCPSVSGGCQAGRAHRWYSIACTSEIYVWNSHMQMYRSTCESAMGRCRMLPGAAAN